jgi:hypothetical protein
MPEQNEQNVIATITYNEVGNKRPFRLGAQELERLILAIPDGKTIKIDKTKDGILLLFFPALNSDGGNCEYPAAVQGVQIDFDKIKWSFDQIQTTKSIERQLQEKFEILSIQNNREKAWKILDIDEKKKLLSNMDLLAKFLDISFRDRECRQKAIQRNQEVGNTMNSQCNDAIAKIVKNFVGKFGPLWICSTHSFCFVKKPSTSRYNNNGAVCLWNYKETVADYIKISRLLYALALCNPSLRMTQEMEKEIEIKQNIARELFRSLLTNWDSVNEYSFVSNWELLALLGLETKQMVNWDTKFYGAFDEALSELINFNPIPIGFARKRQSEDNSEAVFFELGLGIYRILLLQFIQSLLDSGRLVTCSKCFKPYLRPDNTVRGRNYCSSCKKENSTINRDE